MKFFLEFSLYLTAIMGVLYSFTIKIDTKLPKRKNKVSMKKFYKTKEKPKKGKRLKNKSSSRGKNFKYLN